MDIKYRRSDIGYTCVLLEAAGGRRLLLLFSLSCWLWFGKCLAELVGCFLYHKRTPLTRLFCLMGGLVSVGQAAIASVQKVWVMCGLPFGVCKTNDVHSSVAENISCDG